MRHWFRSLPQVAAGQRASRIGCELLWLVGDWRQSSHALLRQKFLIGRDQALRLLNDLFVHIHQNSNIAPLARYVERILFQPSDLSLGILYRFMSPGDAGLKPLQIHRLTLQSENTETMGTSFQVPFPKTANPQHSRAQFWLINIKKYHHMHQDFVSPRAAVIEVDRSEPLFFSPLRQ
ncbi:hypothetical protein [Antarcticimicrobium luteum]|uniref:Uncharacterized protein n=1 Tax=Antarcticimicrobium luteum TaxID=2547397 RepID=A0A4R5VFL2_9RHOB|nr:hypothetical protein [Antarcticimicrobium luteum]TDK51192.1 hypothetical protein E1832_04285 [Antarcticimicrobium luteum]